MCVKAERCLRKKCSQRGLTSGAFDCGTVTFQSTADLT